MGRSPPPRACIDRSPSRRVRAPPGRYFTSAAGTSSQTPRTPSRRERSSDAVSAASCRRLAYDDRDAAVASRGDSSKSQAAAVVAAATATTAAALLFRSTAGAGPAAALSVALAMLASLARRERRGSGDAASRRILSVHVKQACCSPLVCERQPELSSAVRRSLARPPSPTDGPTLSRVFE